MGAQLHAALRLANRAAIEGEIERLIALLDAADGDPDLEPEEDFGIEDRDEGDGDLRGGCNLNGDFGRGLLPDRPVYAVDQRTGPVNYAVAERDHRVREMGLVRSARGGWRQAH